MTDPGSAHPLRKIISLKRWLLPIAIGTVLAGCGGGGGGGGNDQPVAGPGPGPGPGPSVSTAQAQFVQEKFEGLGVRAAGVNDSQVDATGKFNFVVGQPVQFFVGSGNNRVVVGNATLTAVPNGVATVSLHDLTEAQNDADQYLGNLLAWFAALDDNGDLGDGVRIETAARDAVAAAIAGGKTVNFAQGWDDFKDDGLVETVLGFKNRKLLALQEALAEFSKLFRQGRSSSIALTRDDTRAVVVNRQKSTVSVIRVRGTTGQDTGQLIGEVPVGKEPRFVALSPDDRRAYVTNAVDGTMSVIDLTGTTPQVIGSPVPVGLEPRGIAVTPNGQFAVIANHTVGEVTIVRLDNLQIVRTIRTGGNPQSVAITNDGDRNDADERVFVTRMFGELINPNRPDGFDDAKQGVVDTFRMAEAVAGLGGVAQFTLAPVASGFNADRRQFCLNTRKALQDAGTVKFFNSGANGTNDGASQLANSTFCPDVNSTDASDTGPIGRVAQKVYPNMLFSSLIRGSLLYVPNIGAQPEPPVRFNVNIQGLVGVLNRVTGFESDRTRNLNSQVARETQPSVADETKTLDRVFLNDLVAVDADRRGIDFLFVSRGGNYVLRGGVGQDGFLNILDTSNKAIRFQTGNLPTGVVMSGDGKRAYANNELNTSITAMNLENNTVLTRDIESSTPPAPGTVEHRRLFGKLGFFTALGFPDVIDENGDGTFDVPLRDIDPLKHRNKAADNGWSSCASCHDDGHSDNVTWIFETGPRQTIPLEGTFVRNDLKDQRILNWSAVRGSNTDFNNNARGIQGGKGFATDVRGVNRTALVFNHGPVLGVSDSLDAIQEWVATVRAPLVPDLNSAEDAAGRTVFASNCGSCHGGKKWTKSRTAPVYQDNPVFLKDPIGVDFFAGVPPRDAGLTVAGPQIVSVARTNKGTLRFLDNVGTFAATNPLEIRGAAAVAGQSTQGFAAFGGAGFNSPSLLGLSLSAPYFHDGSANTLEDVMARHVINGKTINQTLTAQQAADVLRFIRGIDEQTPPVESDTDRFLK